MNKEQEAIKDKFEKKMAQYSPSDIEKMTDDEILACTNVEIEGNRTRGIALSGKYFESKEVSSEVARMVVLRSRIAHERRGDVPSRPAAYIDIDGTLLDKYGRPSQCLHEFIEQVLMRYVCFWLTTHERDGDKTAIFDHLRRNGVPNETLSLMSRIWPTHWDMLKTEAINFRGDFVWFEDQPLNSELNVLKKNGKSESVYKVDREQGNGLCRWLEDNRDKPVIRLEFN